MRRAVTVLAATIAGLGVPTAATAAPAGPERACRIEDDRLGEISGLAATGSGYVVVNDGSDDPAGRRIFFLDRRCAVVRTVAYPSRPRDTEDLAAAADGTVWVGDIGDNGLTRTTVALWRLAPGSRTPRLFRMAYPDGAHDAEALLLTAAGVPIVVTKAAGSATLYVPAGALRAGRTTALRRAGTVRLPITTTSNPFSLPGRLLVTGAAVSPDGRRAVLRTYADAFEFDAPDGDLVRALTGGTPQTVALPDEPQGESIAYTPDGTALVTVSEAARPAILRYPLGEQPSPSVPATSPATATPPATPTATSTTAAAAPAPADDPVPIGAVVTGGLLTGAAGLLVALALRRRRASRR